MNPYLCAIKTAFVDAKKPEHFTDFTHCCECMEHDDTLRSHSRESISLHELGNPGWDPICFINLEGFTYYFPALAELAMGQGDAYYLDQFVFHLNADRIGSFNDKQRLAVHDFLKYLQTEFTKELSIESLTRYDLAQLIERLKPDE